MKFFNKILVPVDFSAQSKAAVRKGFQLARQCHSNEVHLLSVVDINTLGSFVRMDTYAFQDTGLITARINESKEKLEELVEEVTDKGNTKIITVVIEGDYLRALIKYALQFGIDLVIMPASARPCIRQFMFGTNMQSVFAAISCPVLTYQAADVPAGTRRIILPVEDDYPISKLHYATILSKLTGAEIHLVCLRQKLHSLQKSTFSALFRISEQLDLTGSRYKIYAADGKNITDVILHYAEREQIDLILVNPREQSAATEKCIEYLGTKLSDYTDLSVSPQLSVD